MWKLKLFNTRQELLAWLNDKDTVMSAQKIQIIKPECNTVYEVFYWDNRIIEKEYY